MEIRKGDIVNKKSFLEKGLFAKEEYEGLLVSSDSAQQCYNLGVQLDEDRILVVDQVREGNIEEKVGSWSKKIQEIQKA
ncbi:MAG: hypothetical protein PHE82_02555 [Syntrophomonadaceae bacterium]|nr:hypothetical protein [Syntrophomonadaceae bacterium]